VESEELPSVISIITVVVDPDEGVPRVDLGSMSPAYAYTMLRSAAEAVYDTIPLPTVISNGEVIADFAWLDNLDDDDDWD
jgi:hypothetical protein